MIKLARRRPPTPVVVAVVLHLLRYVVAPVAVELWGAISQSIQAGFVRWDVSWIAMDVIVTGLLAMVAIGLWRGKPIARAAAIGIAALGIVLSVVNATMLMSDWTYWWILDWSVQVAYLAAIVRLLHAPSSKIWFADGRTTPDPTATPVTEARA